MTTNRTMLNTSTKCLGEEGDEGDDGGKGEFHDFRMLVVDIL